MIFNKILTLTVCSLVKYKHISALALMGMMMNHLESAKGEVSSFIHSPKEI